MSRIVRSPLAIAAILVVALTHALGAHDFWLEPSSFAPPTGSALRVHFRVGDHFSGEPLGRNDTRIQRFVAIAPDGSERPIVGRHGVDPAGIVRVDSPGLWTLAYSGTPSAVTLAADAFEAYLKEEGLEHVSRLRASQGATERPGREHFSRAVKSLVIAGAPAASPAGYDRAVGLRLEIVPGENPFDDGRTQLPVRLLFEGEPLAGALVVAMRKPSAGAPAEVVSSVRSDAQGHAMVTTGPGLWLIKAVHMVPASEGSAVDWESTWTSMTFEVSRRMR